MHWLKDDLSIGAGLHGPALLVYMECAAPATGF